MRGVRVSQPCSDRRDLLDRVAGSVSHQRTGGRFVRLTVRFLRSSRAAEHRTSMSLTSAVIILCQPAETAVTALTLHHLVRDQDTTTSIHVLMNGGFVGELREIAPRSPAISYYSSPANLGVAGGRNFLLRRPEVQASDVIVVLDNDVITPPQHVDSTGRGRGDGPGCRRDRTSRPRPARPSLRALGVNGTDLERPITNERLSETWQAATRREAVVPSGTAP